MQGRIENENRLDGRIEKKLEMAPDYVKKWQRRLKASGKTAASRTDYLNKIMHFLSWIDKDTRNIQIDNLSEDLIDDYFIDIQTTTKLNGNEVERTSDDYRQGVYYALQNFFDFLYNRGMIKTNIMRGIEKPKKKANINAKKEFLTERDFKLILHYAHMEKDPVVKKRDLAILTLFMVTGMRKNALRQINISDFDFTSNTLVVIDKEEATQTYPLSNQTVSVINEWLEKRKMYTKTDSYTDALFISNRGLRISERALDKIVDKYAQKAIGRHISPHKLRAGYCSILYDKTKDVEFVRRAVGHARITTTQLYIRTNGSERNKAADIMNGIF